MKHFRIPGVSRRVDAACIVSATVVAVCGLFGWTPSWFPMEKLGIGADIGAGGFAAWHRIKHITTKEQ